MCSSQSKWLKFFFKQNITKVYISFALNAKCTGLNFEKNQFFEIVKFLTITYRFLPKITANNPGYTLKNDNIKRSAEQWWPDEFLAIKLKTRLNAIFAAVSGFSA
ncbi:hypothetical protein BpHYR1_045296 [Brachionus plicatilis]|uniref:Uncharacterized protein n=1 Tax=Brachionus plicatilis TaxID=10195 RepID=A0A3M7SN44_BRAPC|nr:hypothetical protein BpHYR1_045296 [Brachionus plicatilis]